MKKVFFPNLDGLRFVAFFLVFWQHGFFDVFLYLKDRNFLNDSTKQFFVTGGYGVSFFFVLSGFLITYLLITEVQENGSINLKNFYVRRILRIFPLYYLVIFWTFAVYPMLRYLLNLPSYSNGNPLLYIFFLSNFDLMSGVDRSLFAGVTWSVSIEEQFYIFWALLFFFLPFKMYKYLFPAVIIFSTLFHYFNQFDTNIGYFHTFSVISDLAIGGLTAYLAINTKNFTYFFEKLNKQTIICVYIFGGLWILFLPFFVRTADIGAINRLVTATFFAFIITEQNFSTNSFYKMEKYKLISKLGIYTYGLYLLHPIAIYIVGLMFKGISNSDKSLFYILIQGGMGFVLSMFLAVLSYHYYESPFLRLKKHFQT